ncbi:MAG: 4Fe-4S binding protein [Ignavibacteriales bacterium]|nr:4Fe-4S binding protein [Ignavibacteriales bacterium]MCB9258943.1 4Fe-4S binding protein [Ignavibacteriales bacterium]
MSKINKNLETPIQKYRTYIQLFFVAIVLWIGIEFYLFTTYLESGGATTFYERPPGVEAFLPISSLMSLYYFILSGEIHQAHPAGLIIFIAILTVSFVIGKSFCSWICPIGFISESLGDFGERIRKKLFKKRIQMPRLLDYPLRSLKYLLLGFFAYSIFFSMTAVALKYFLDSPYNIISDVKMYYFFANISRFSLYVIFGLIILSVIFRNFWCRYLCPYGALLGFFSLFSPTKIKRNKESCIDCNLCAKACPSFIKVDKVSTVISDECTSCLSCIDACPVENTLDLKTVYTGKKVSKKLVAFGVVAIYFIIITLGMISGNWKNNVPKEQYIELYKQKNSIGHIRSSNDVQDLNKQAEEQLK